MNKCNLLFRHTSCHQLCLDVIIDIECAIVFWGGEVAEQKLGQLIRLTLLPNAENIANTGIEFAVWVIGQQRVH